jgi:autotransporter-associated beta strand protein
LNVHSDSALGTGKVAMTSNKFDQTATIKFMSATPAIGSLESSGLGIKSIVLGAAASSGLQGKWTSGSNIITLSAAAASHQLAVGQAITGSAANGIPATAVITELISDTQIKISENATITKTGNTPLTANAANTTLTIGALNTDTLFAGVISQATGATGGITKTGSGIQTLSGANTYTGSTTIKAGSLVLGASGTIADSATVIVGDTGSSGTILDLSAKTSTALKSLGGIGTVNLGTSTLSLSGLAPGDGVGTLTISSTGAPAAVTLDSLSTLNYELDGDNSTVGGGINDLVIVTGDLTLDGTLTVSGPNFASAVPGDTYRLFTYSGTLTNNTLDLGSMPTLPGDYTFSIDTATTGQVNLVVSGTGPGTSTFEGWASSQVPPVTGGTNGDSDNDGIPNGVEYGLNTNPAASDSAPGTYTGTLLSFAKRELTSSNTDLSYRIEVSPDLGITPWVEVGSYVTDTTSVLSANIPTGPGLTKYFARLRVVVTP